MERESVHRLIPPKSIGPILVHGAIYQYCTYGTHQTRVRVLPSGGARVIQWVAQDYELHSRQNEVTSSEKASFSTLSYRHRC